MSMYRLCKDFTTKFSMEMPFIADCQIVFCQFCNVREFLVFVGYAV